MYMRLFFGTVLSRLAIPAIGLASLALFAGLYVNHPYVYQTVMTAFIKVPWSLFADWEWIPSVIECWTKGVNVYVNNTCSLSFTNATFNYSPLWLRITFLQFAHGWTILFGFAIAALFFLSLALLSPPRTRSDCAITLLATISSATALAVERANTDLLMFLMIIVSVYACNAWLPIRTVGYALITLAGLLKFYPMVALIIALRERPAVIVTVALTAGTALAAMISSYYGEIVRMMANLPVASYFTLQFSAKDLPGGLGFIASRAITKLFHQDATIARALNGFVYWSVLLLLIVLASAAATWLGHRGRIQSALAQLPTRDAGFLVVGAAIICGCFFAGQSVLYKGIFLLLALPGLLALSHNLPWQPARIAFRGGSVAIVFVLWFVFFEWCIGAAGLGKPPRYMFDEGQSGPLGYLLWFFNELAWWWIIIVLLTALGGYVLNSELWAVLSRVLPLPARWRVDRGALAEPPPP
jgi:hypothetical protein